MPNARSTTSSPLRAIFAALLMLALLSTAVPFAALSAAHSCAMPCCAEGACATGACQGALFKSKKKSEDEKLCGTEDAHQSHGAKKNPATTTTPAQTSTDADHCSSEEKETATGRRPNDQLESQTDKANLVSALAIASPCSKDCCAGASASAQSRRGRDAALLFALDRALPPAFISLSLYSQNLPPLATAHLKRLRARAPPVLSASSQD